MVGELGGYGSRSDEVRSGEGGEEVVKCDLVGDVDDGHGSREGSYAFGFAAEEIVLAKGEVEEAA